MDDRQGPRHVGIIMDGNGRWASGHGWRRLVGHKRGADQVMRIIETAAEMNLEALSLFCFSTENWLRPEEEVNFLMALMNEFVDSNIDRLVSLNTKAHVLGDLTRAPKILMQKLEDCVMRTRNNSGLCLNFMVSYGGRLDILQATRKIATLVKLGRLTEEEITEDYFSKQLLTSETKDPDLIIRTSGEFRVSNFMLWQSAYSEFYVSEKFWPDFGPDDFKKACAHYQNRDRRFGRVRIEACP